MQLCLGLQVKGYYIISSACIHDAVQLQQLHSVVLHPACGTKWITYHYAECPVLLKLRLGEEQSSADWQVACPAIGVICVSTNRLQPVNNELTIKLQLL